MEPATGLQQRSSRELLSPKSDQESGAARKTAAQNHRPDRTCCWPQFSEETGPDPVLVLGAAFKPKTKTAELKEQPACVPAAQAAFMEPL